MAHLKMLPQGLACHRGRCAPKGLSALSRPERGMLNLLRLMALNCRTSARVDLFDACTVLSRATRVSQSMYAKVLMRCLPQALCTTPVFFRPNVEEISFDEAWLLKAINASHHDRSNFEFLIRSRIQRVAQRNIGTLVSALTLQD